MKIFLFILIAIFALANANAMEINEDLPPQNPVIGIYTQTHNGLPN